MIIDTSVLIAILLDEPEAEQLIEAMAADEKRMISAVSMVEAGIVILNRKGEAGLRELDTLTAKAAIVVTPVDAQQSVLAREAFFRFGKGRHPAKLNFGDCFSYALAKALQQPLLFKGDDFNRTDIPCCIDWNLGSE